MVIELCHLLVDQPQDQLCHPGGQRASGGKASADRAEHIDEALLQLMRNWELQYLLLHYGLGNGAKAVFDIRPQGLQSRIRLEGCANGFLNGLRLEGNGSDCPCLLIHLTLACPVRSCGNLEQPASNDDGTISLWTIDLHTAKMIFWRSRLFMQLSGSGLLQGKGPQSPPSWASCRGPPPGTWLGWGLLGPSQSRPGILCSPASEFPVAGA